MLNSLPKLVRRAVSVAASIIVAAPLAMPAVAEPAPGASSAPADFYQPPQDLPETPGTLVHAEDAPQLLNLADPIAHQLGLPQPNLPGQAHRMMYTSTNAYGDPVGVTGVVLEPAKKWAKPGPTPTIIMAPGTRGQGDTCAPSQGPLMLGNIDLDQGTLAVNYDLPAMYAASLAGMRVILTDYMGLGTPGMHHYVHREEQAHAVIDAARAGLALAGEPMDSPIAFYGYSQGGGAAAAAAEEVAGYAPELDLVATYAGAPPADLFSVLHAADASSITGLLGYALNSAQDLDEAVKEAVRRNVSKEAQANLDKLGDSCLPETISRWSYEDSATLLGGDMSLQELIDAEPAVGEYLEQQALGVHPISGAMLVVSHLEDDLIPYDQAHAMAAGYCQLGGSVDLRSAGLPGLMPKSGINHVLPGATHTLAALQWIQDRFAGEPAPNGCAGILDGATPPVLPAIDGAGLLSSGSFF